MRAKTILAAIAGLTASAALAAPGNILSSFATSEASIWGVEVRQTSTATEIYVVSGTSSVYRFDINGTSKMNMISSSSSVSGGGLYGLAICHTWEGSYATEFIGIAANGTSYRSRWGVDGTGDKSPGNLTWGLTNGGAINSTGDIAAVSRTADHAGIWTVKGTTLYKYGYPTWGVTSSTSYDVASFLAAGSSLTGVALGENNDVWLLASDGRILDVTVTDNGGGVWSYNVAKTFNIDASITKPWGIGYDTEHDTLWISNQADNSVYQIQTVNVPEPGAAGLVITGGVLALCRRSRF